MRIIIKLKMIRYLYTDENDLEEAFMFRSELLANKKSYFTFKQTLRLLMIFASGFNLLQTYLYFSQMVQMSWLSLILLILTFMSLICTYRSVLPSNENNVTLRQWAHTLTTTLFLACFWHTVIYVLYLRPFLGASRLPQTAFFIDLSEYITLMPPFFITLNLAVSNMIILDTHSKLVLVIFALYQYLRFEINSMVEKGSVMHIMSFDGLIDSIGFIIILCLFYVPQWMIVRFVFALQRRTGQQALRHYYSLDEVPIMTRSSEKRKRR